MDVVLALQEIVLPSFEAIFAEGELEKFGLEKVHGHEGEVVRIDLSLSARGETFRHRVYQAEGDGVGTEIWRDRLTGALRDFVAESGFGWGQVRGVP